MVDVLAFSRARETLNKRGWCKGIRHDSDGKSCLLGAFEEGWHEQVELKNPEEIKELADTIRNSKRFKDRVPKSPIFNYNVSIIACFNNDAHTTLADVKEVLHRAAQRVKRRLKKQNA